MEAAGTRKEKGRGSMGPKRISMHCDHCIEETGAINARTKKSLKFFESEYVVTLEKRKRGRNREKIYSWILCILLFFVYVSISIGGSPC